MTLRFVILDGERRWRAAKLVGLSDLDAIVLKTRPSATELRLLQMTIDEHRSNHKAMERSDFLNRLKRENAWSVQELADRLQMKQPLVTKLLALQRACPELRTALCSASLDLDKAYTICQEPEHDKQRELLKVAGDLTREQLRQKARAKGQSVALKTSVARFALPKGLMVTVQGPKMDLSGAIEAMLQALRVLKRGQADSWDIVTASCVMRDRANATN